MPTSLNFSKVLGAVAPIVAISACRRDGRTPRVEPTPVANPTSSAAPDATSVTALSPLLAAPDSGAKPRARSANLAKPGEKVTIPSGRFLAGSLPGDDGRDPRSEPVALSVVLDAFEIDRLPYPNDPREPPRTEVGVKEAAHLCAARGQRLCTELEWELACKGAAGDAYSTGNAWDTGCSREPVTCASSSGVIAMGALREWTASEVLTFGKEDNPLPAVRGAATTADPSDHRCAHRTVVQPTARTRDLGFRCCAGPANGAAIPTPKLGPIARKITLEPAQLAEIFAAIPQLQPIEPPIRYFDPDDTVTVLRRGKTGQGAGDPEGYTLTTSPVLWNPAPGEEIVVVLGHAVKDSFIVALYKLPDNRFRLASSLLLMNDLGPFVLAHRPEVRERLLWSSCWKCSGEGGAVSFRDGRRVVIVQQ